MQSQILGRSLINLGLGMLVQGAMDRADNPASTQLIGAGVLTGVGVGFKLWQYLGSRPGQRRPWLDLLGDAFTASGVTIGGQSAAMAIDARLLAQPVQPVVEQGTGTSTPSEPTTPSTGNSNGLQPATVYSGSSSLSDSAESVA
jgi:hypothetical protein